MDVKAPILMLKSNFLHKKDDKVVNGQLSPNLQHVALLTENNTLIINKLQRDGETRSFSVENVSSFAWQSSSSTCAENAFVIIQNLQLSTYKVKEECEVVKPYVKHSFTNLQASLLTRQIEVGNSFDVVILSFDGNDIITFILNNEHIIRIKLLKSDELSIVNSFSIADSYVNSSRYKYDFASDTLFIMSSDETKIFVYSIYTGIKIDTLDLNPSFMDEKIRLCQVSTDKHFIAVCSDENEIIVINNELKDEEAVKKHAVVTGLNKLQKNVSTTEKKLCRIRSLSLVEPEMDVKKITFSLNSLLVWQCDECSVQLTYVGFHDLDIVSKYRVETSYWVIIDESAFHPPLLMTENGIYVMPSCHVDENIINKVMVYGSVSAAENLSCNNNWQYVTMPLNVLDLGLNYHQLDTISFFMKSREEVIAKQLISSYKEIKAGKYEQAVTSDEMMRLAAVEHHNNDVVMNLLINNIEFNMNDGKSQQFAEQLLQITVHYVTRILKLTCQHRDAVNDPTINTIMSTIIKQAVEHSLRLRNFVKKNSQLTDRKSLCSLTGDVEKPDRTNSSFVVDEYPEKIRRLFNSWDEMPVAELIDDGLRKGFMSSLITYINLRQKDVLSPSLSAYDYVVLHGSSFALKYLENQQMEPAALIISNMGIDVVSELKNICFQTFSVDLRKFIESELLKLNALSVEERSCLNYVDKLVTIYPNQRFTKCPPSDIHPSLKDSLFYELLNENCESKGENFGGNYLCVSAEWVKNWDEQTRDLVIVDGIVNSGSEDDLKEMKKDIIWEYFLIRNHSKNLFKWIKIHFSNGRRGSREEFPFDWPITIDMVDRVPELCSEAVASLVLDQLSRCGVFCKHEREDFSLILKRLCKFGGLQMVDSIFNQSSSVINATSFHDKIIDYCFDRDLPKFLWVYMDYYKLEPERIMRCKEDQNDLPKWTKVLIAFLHWKSHPTDLSKVFAAGVSNFQYLTDVKDDENLDLNKHRDLFYSVLSSVLYKSEELEKMLHGENFDDVFSISSKSFKSVAASYPNLSVALYPSEESTDKRSISLYKLMERNSMLNTRQLFGWQKTNDVKTKDALSTFPHFSNPTLREKYGHTEELNLEYYLKNGRPCFAFSKFISENIKLTGSVCKRSLERACDLSHRLAFDNFTSSVIVSSCVAFIEMLGHDSLALRCRVDVANIILRWKNSINLLSNERQQKLNENELKEMLLTISGYHYRLLDMLEEALVFELDSNSLARTSVEALLRWNVAVLFCSVHNINKTKVFLKHCAEANNWLMFLVFSQIHQYPKEVINDIILEFPSSHLKEHLQNAVRHLQTFKRKILQPHSPSGNRDVRASLYSKIGVSKKVVSAGSTTVHQETNEVSKLGATISEYTSSSELNEDQVTVSNSSNQSIELDAFDELPSDIFSVILKCHGRDHPWKSLLISSHALRKPILCVIAATYHDSCILDCLSSYLYTCGPEIIFAQVSISDIATWTWNQLTALMLELINHDLVSVVFTAFHVFHPTSPLYHLLDILDRMMCRKHLSVPDDILRNFQDAFLRIDETPDIVDPMSSRLWLEQTSMDLIKQSLIRCCYVMEQYLLVSCFASTNFILLFTEIDFVPNFILLNCILEAIKAEEISVNVENLLSDDQSVFTTEIILIVDALVDLKLHSIAKKICKLTEQPVDSVILSQVKIKLDKLSSTEDLSDSQAKINFWLECYSIFVENGLKYSSVFPFFEESVTKSDCPYERHKLYQLMIRCSQDNETFADNYEELQARMWWNKIMAEAATPYMDGLRSSAQGPVSDLLNTSVTGVEPYQRFSENQDFLALERTIGHELSNGRLQQALKISALFDYQPQDLLIVINCIQLAKGEIKVSNLPPSIRSLLSKNLIKKYNRKVSVVSLSSSPMSFDSDTNTSQSLSDSTSPLPSQAEVTCLIGRLKSACVDAEQCCSRILTYYEIAVALQLDYSAVIAQIRSEDDVYQLLRNLLISNSDDKFVLAKELMSTHCLGCDGVNDFLHKEVLKSLHTYYGTGPKVQGDSPKSSRELIFNPSDNLGSFLQIINLTSSPSDLGRKLLDEIDLMCEAIDNEESNCYSLQAELCIRSHECYTAACNMEGISRVLKKARSVTSQLEKDQEFALIVRLLTGIGRYGEMNYVFDLLREHDKYELLFRKGMEKVQNLKVSFLEYLKRFHRNDYETYNMVALHFLMYREIAETLEANAKARIKDFEDVEYFDSTKEIKVELQHIVQYLADAAESYVKAECLRHAHSCACKAELVALQIYSIPDKRKVIALNSRQVIQFIRDHQNFPETQIVAKAYENDHEWSMALFNNFIVKDNRRYLQDMEYCMGITTAIVEDVEKWYSKLTNRSDTITRNMRQLLKYVDNIELRYTMAKRLGFDDVTEDILKNDGGNYISDLLSLGIVNI
ncbi:Uncharacterised protein g6334 [Pycnogonum litorale]